MRAGNVVPSSWWHVDPARVGNVSGAIFESIGNTRGPRIGIGQNHLGGAVRHPQFAWRQRVPGGQEHLSDEALGASPRPPQTEGLCSGDRGCCAHHPARQCREPSSALDAICHQFVTVFASNSKTPSHLGVHWWA